MNCLKFFESNREFKAGRGFTMVEVIIVVAIIAILASIIMPKMTGARTRANLSACMQNIRQIAMAMEMYSNDNNGYHTPYTDGVWHSAFTPNYLIPDYLKALPVCPTGHTYSVTANCGWGSSSAHSPSPADIVLSMCGIGSGYAPEDRHPGLSRWCPQYVIGSGILKNY